MDRFLQGVDFEGFGEVFVHACGDGALPVVFEAVGGEADDGYVLVYGAAVAFAYEAGEG